MPYCTADDLIRWFGESELLQLTDDAGVGDIDYPKVDEAIAVAGGLIDDILRGTYSVPIDPAPAVLERIACDLARFSLYVDDYPDHVKAARDHAIKMLERYRDGQATLGISTGQDDTTGRYSVVAPAQVFTEKLLKGRA